MPFKGPSQDTRTRWRALPLIAVVVDLVLLRGRVGEIEKAAERATFSYDSVRSMMRQGVVNLEDHSGAIVGRADHRFTARALVLIDAGIRRHKLEDRLLAIVQAGLAQPWNAGHFLAGALCNERKRAASDLAQLVLTSACQLAFKLLDPVTKGRCLIFQGQYLAMRRAERCLHLKDRLLRRRNRRLLRAAQAADPFEDIHDPTRRPDDRTQRRHTLTEFHRCASREEISPEGSSNAGPRP